ncbi:MAG TPA: HNH endonuclease [Bacillota bacterium]|nr:HNH endonuclease [Bacillota bacterium]
MLEYGSKITNDELTEFFMCSHMGGMRRSKRKNALILISYPNSFYKDRWEKGVFHYTGMGKKGDQCLEFAQNKTLKDSRDNGVEVHLFEVDKENVYEYIGRVKLIGMPYQEKQLDEDGKCRLVWIFKLGVIF